MVMGYRESAQIMMHQIPHLLQQPVAEIAKNN